MTSALERFADCEKMGIRGHVKRVAEVGLGIGYRYGRSYGLSFAQISLELTVVVPTPAGRDHFLPNSAQLCDLVVWYGLVWFGMVW